MTMEKNTQDLRSLSLGADPEKSAKSVDSSVEQIIASPKETEEHKTETDESQHVTQTFSANNNGGSAIVPEHDPTQFLTLRGLITSAEGGVVIGRGGKNVGILREQTGCKVGVSKGLPGVHDRVLSVSGSMQGVAKAYGFICQTMLDNPTAPVPNALHQANVTGPTVSIRLLITHNLMGSVIGKSGSKIKQIQDLTNVRMAANKEMLPQSTERVVDIHGEPQAIASAILEINKCLCEDWQNGQGTVPYIPSAMHEQQQQQAQAIQHGYNNTYRQPSLPASASYGSNLYAIATPGLSANQYYPPPSRRGSAPVQSSYAGASNLFASPTSGMSAFTTPAPPRRSSVVEPTSTTLNYDSPALGSSAVMGAAYDDFADVAPGMLQTQNLSIPADLVGCIIGKGGSKITEIRRASRSKISIAKHSHDKSGERLFSITGLPQDNERTMYRLYNELNHECNRRLQETQQEPAVYAYDQ